MSDKIILSDVEISSGLDRVRFAELLILQLPADHDGRNTWLLNYGKGEEAENLRKSRREEAAWDDRTDSLRSTGGF